MYYPTKIHYFCEIFANGCKIPKVPLRNSMANDIQNISIADYSYPLPAERIAKHPLEQRDSSKLLVYRNGLITTDVFSSIDTHIPQNSLLILNNTRVVRARLRFKKASGATIEVFLFEPISPLDYALSFASTGQVVWKCMVGNLKRWKDGSLELPIPHTSSVLKASKIECCTQSVEVKFTWDDPALPFARIVELSGEVPIPPYLNRPSEDTDNTRYQTVYANPEGSVAAPTAGLHFTQGVLSKLSDKGIIPQHITLHVGAGTFKPMKEGCIGEHEMHTEHFIVERSLIAGLHNAEGQIFVVGTTTLRTLESLYWLGVKAFNGQLCAPLFIGQWEPYSLQPIDPKAAFDALMRYLDEHELNICAASTQIMIAPGYRVRTADALITNFHQPKSTLLLLVAAAVGDDWRKIYDYALKNDFRFLSYGDSSILYIND